MVIRFEAVNPAPARIVEMNADEDAIFLRVLNCHALLEWNENVGRSRHHDFQIGFVQFASETFRDIERRDFLGAAKFAVSAVVFAAMPSIDHNRAERFARISYADFSRPGSSNAGGE